MNRLLINILATLYLALSLATYGLMLAHPFGLAMGDYPTWIGWIVFPLGAFLIVTQKKVLKFLNND